LECFWLLHYDIWCSIETGHTYWAGIMENSTVIMHAQYACPRAGIMAQYVRPRAGIMACPQFSQKFFENILGGSYGYP